MHAEAGQGGGRRTRRRLRWLARLLVCCGLLAIVANQKRVFSCSLPGAARVRVIRDVARPGTAVARRIPVK